MKIINYIYLLYDEESRECAIIDPAWDISSLEKYLSENNLILKYVFLTHSHIDHTNKAEYLTTKYNAMAVMSNDEAFYYHFNCFNLMLIDDDDEFFLGGYKIKCLLCPGHTAGSMCYMTDRFIFTGDTLFTEGCGICFDDGADSLKMFRSLQRLKSYVDKSVIVYPGHKYQLNIGCDFEYVLKHNIYLQIDDPEVFCKFRDRKNQKNLFNFN